MKNARYEIVKCCEQIKEIDLVKCDDTIVEYKANEFGGKWNQIDVPVYAYINKRSNNDTVIKYCPFCGKLIEINTIQLTDEEMQTRKEWTEFYKPNK